MKTTIKIILIMSFINSFNAFSQTNFGCATEPENTNFAPLSAQNSIQSCSKTSTDWVYYYSLTESYKPTNSSYIGIKTIPINIVVFGESDGSLFPFHIGEQDMPNMATYYDMNGVEIVNPYSTSSPNVENFDNWLNNAYLNPDAPSGNGIYYNGPGPIGDVPYTFSICNPTSLPDSKIRFIIKHFYFYRNSTINSSVVFSQAAIAAANATTPNFSLMNSEGSIFQNNIDLQSRNLHLGNNPDAINQINCYLFKSFNYPGAGGWSYEAQYNNQTISYTSSTSHMNGSANQIEWNSGFWYFYDHLPHELGHRLGLWHIYQNEVTNQNSPEFLNDVFKCPGATPITGGNNLMGNAFTEAISPKQMGRMHRALTTDLNFQNLGNATRHFAYGYSPTPHEITSNETWDFTYKSYNNIVVKSGATLTLKCRLEMVKEASIIVEQGATLIIDGARITSARSAGLEHEGPWQGIQVWGTNNKTQFQLDPSGFLYQGRVEILNGAVIENAEIAIEVNKPGTITGGGGIVRMINSTIRNCWKGVTFAKYNNSVRSSFKDCIFETTTNLINGDVPQVFIEAWDFKTLRVISCTFRNTNPSVTHISQLGNGIGLLSSKAIISGTIPQTFNNNNIDYCDATNPNWKPNIFENLNKGVELINFGMQQTNGLYTSSITRNYFKNCIMGVECKGMPAVSINQNKIDLGGNSVYSNYTEGIVHKSYTGFSISENCLNRTGNNTNYSGGIIVTEVGGDNNEVYRNKSFDNDCAFLSNGKNKTAAPTSDLKFKGLQFLCNQNNGNFQEYDIAVEGDGIDPSNTMNGIRFYQGGAGNSQNPRAAGNIFTSSCQTSESDYYNNTINPLVYFHTNNQSETPNCYSWNVSLSNGQPNPCPSKFGNGIGSGIISASQKTMLLANYGVVNSQFLAIALLYNNIIDNGNTQSLLQSISSEFSTDASNLKSVMLNNSPNLSDEVVQTLIRENTILQNSDLYEIVSANPDVAKNEELLRMLKEKTNPLDEWMIEFLREAGTYETNRTLLEQTFAQKQYEREEIAWQMVRHILTDTISDTLNHAELHQWLNIIGSPRAKYMIADDYASLGDFSLASQILNNIQDRNLDRYEIAELNALKEWLALQSTLKSEGRTVYELTNTEINSIRPFAEKERMYGLTGTFAANVINLYEPNSYNLPIIYPHNNNAARTSNNSKEQKKKRTIKKLSKAKVAEISNSEITIYPNPINNQATIDLGNVTNAVKVSVFSVKGELVINQTLQGEKLVKLNTSNLANGTYSLQLLDSKGNTIKTEKLIVQNN